jgi:hypothetical protein
LTFVDEDDLGLLEELVDIFFCIEGGFWLENWESSGANEEYCLT